MEIAKMEPVTWTVIAVVAALSAGFGAGWGLKKDKASDVLVAHSQSLDALLDGQTEILTEAQKPVVIDAELRATLAGVPVQCQKSLGGDPRSVECQWATCLQFGQSSAQRPECGDVTELMIEVLKVRESK